MRERIATGFFLFLLIIVSVFPSAASDSAARESWHSIYSGGERIGYRYGSIAESDGYIEVIEKEKMKVKLLDAVQEIETDTGYRLNGYEIDSFTFDFKSPAGEVHGTGARKGDSLEMRIKTVSGETAAVFPAKGEMMPPSLVAEWLSEKNLEPGQEYRVVVFDPTYVAMGAKPNDLVSVHKVIGREKVDVPSLGPLEAWRIDSDMLGTRFTTWMTDDGEVLKQEMPPGITVLKDTRENVFATDLSDWDVTEETSIPANVDLKDPRALKYMKVGIEGIGPAESYDLDDGYRQTVRGDTVEIKAGGTSDIETYTLPYAGDRYKPYLTPDSSSQSGDEEIIEASRKILAGETDSLEAASKINRWVFDNLKKEGTASLPNAKDVLKTRSGDCNEHAALFAALSRAAGIPTKMVSGTIYIDGRFYYHAWNEVYVGEWIAVDPTFGQVPADASHIKFVDGDFADSSRIMNLVGKINLKILEAS